MNANSLWAGNDYAYVAGRGRGQNWSDYAERVRVIKVVKEREWGNQRDSAYALVNYVDDEGSLRKNYQGEPIMKKVRARDIMMRWTEYEQERIHREEKVAELRAVEEANRRKEQAEKNRIFEAMEAKGMERTMVVSVGSSHISLRLDTFKSWLGIDVKEAIVEVPAVDRVMYED